MKRILILLFMLTTISIYSVEYLSEKSEYIDIYFEKLENGGYSFYGDNHHFIPQFVSLGFTKLLNLQMDKSNPALIVLQPGEEKVLITTLKPIQVDKSYSFRSRLSWTFGDPVNINPDDYIYMFPFSNGGKFKLDQGFGGKFSHQNENFFALDFSMDIGTPVYASRDGIVIEVKEDSNRGGASSSYADDANFVSVYHSDGTFASYVHLKQNGATVEVGDLILEGDLVGYSGNTGLSTGPHLHFSVNVPTAEGVRQSIPIRMKDIDGNAIDPVVGEYYYAKHPLGEDFEVFYGKDLVNEDYKNYMSAVPLSNTFNFRDENIDSTTVIFCQNGYNSQLDGEVTFKLRNSVVSKSYPIKVIIPPLSEVFLCIVNSKDPSKASGFSYNISYSVLE